MNDTTTHSRPVPKPRRHIQIVSHDRDTKYENVTINTEIFDAKANLNDEISFDATDNIQGVYKQLLDDAINIENNFDKARPVAAPRRPSKPKDPITLKNNNVERNTTTSDTNQKHKESNNLKSYVKNETIKETNKSKSTFHVNYAPPPYTAASVDPELSRGDNLRKSFSPSNSTGSTHSSSEHIPKYKSDSPRNSYTPDDDESNDSKSSELLKSLGATSKLLTASIGERISVKTKGARHKMDKSLKISREKLGSWGHETSDSVSNTFKSVKTKISSGVSGFSLSREHKSSDADESNGSAVDDEMLKHISFNSPLNNNKHAPVPADTCYETPKKNKPVVQPSPKSGISSQYSSFSSSPISLTDSDTSLSLKSSKLVFERNDRTSRSFYSEIDSRNNQANSTANYKLYKNKSESNIFKLSTTMEEKYVDSVSSNESLPCPTIPAPVLNREEIYGKIKSNNEIKSPARPPRVKKKSYENVEIRPAAAGGVSSTRATVDSADIFSRNLENDVIEAKTYPNIFSRQVNKLFPEGNTNRSESWKFYDTTEDRDASSPEPVYENSEPMYGKLFEMDSNNDKYLLQPQSRNSNKPIAPNMFKHDDDFDCFPTTSSAINERKHNNSKELTLPRDILNEFDPLLNRSNDNLLQDNNNLLLLEDLLNIDNYGKAKETTDGQSLNSFDSIEDLYSEAQSDEVLNAPAPPERTDSLNVEVDEAPKSTPRQPKPSTSRNMTRDSGEMMIIHQNMNLRSDSMENIVDETVVQQYLSQREEPEISDALADLSRPGASRSNWFLDGSEENYLKQQQHNTLNCNDKNAVDKIVKTVPKLTLCDQNEPPPPSYFEATTKATVNNKPKIVPETTPPPSPSTHSKHNSSVKNMFSSVMNLGRKNSVRNPLMRAAIQMVPKPMLSQRYIHHEGHLIRFPTRVVEDILKELSPRNAELREKRFTAYLDPQHKTVKEQFLLEYIITIQCIDNQKISNTPDMHCFELTVGLPKNQAQHLQTTSNPNMIISSTNSGNVKTSRVCHVYGVAKRSERNLWMQKLIESMTEVFPQKFTCEYTRAGWCYLKTSITSAWTGAWILLSGRKFLFYTSADEVKDVLDLRKARCIVLKEHDESINNLHVEEGPLLMIDCPPFTLYMIMNCPRETKVWRHIIKESAHNNGTSLKRQQLTKDNVPVIVDKCINFIYANGSMSEGIYRKAGSENAIERLLAAFRSNAFSVQLIRNEFTEHDVSNALKRFMRELPERLLERHATSFLEVSKMKSAKDKIVAYKTLLENLSIIEYATLRKLIGHLNFIQSQKHVNKMGVSNLSLIWGIALLRKNKDDSITFHEQDAKVVADLITLYKNLFPLTADEIAKEQIMLSVLQKYHAAAENLSDTVKQSGDLKIWITIDTNPDNSTEEKRQINVSLTPTKTVYDVCKELASHMKLEPYKLTLKEVILNGDLYRPMHYTERVLDTVLKWTYWQDADRKDNFLKVVPTRFLEYIDRTIKSLGSIVPNSELKFADNKTKGLKQFTLELIDDRIVVMKKEEKKQTIVKVKEILLNEVTTYIGHEKKRDLSTRWAITLLDNKFKKRNRDTPFVGHVIAGTNLNDQYVWYSHIMFSLHKRDILPGPEIIMT